MGCLPYHKASSGFCGGATDRAIVNFVAPRLLPDLPICEQLVLLSFVSDQAEALNLSMR